MEPSAFFVSTPRAASSLESLPMAFFSFDAAPVMSDMDTSTRSEAYWNFCSSSTLKPVCFAIVFSSSADAAVFIARPPIAPSAPAAAPLNALVLSATFPAASDTLSAACAMPDMALLVSSEAVFRFSTSRSVEMISLCKAMYWSEFLSTPFLSIVACACLRVSSFFFVFCIWSPKSFCFWASSSVFLGSNFRSLSTSLSCFCVLLRSPLTSFNACDKPEASPPSSIVIPRILSAIYFFPPKKA